METVRINSRISVTANDWLDKESKATGLTKSAIVMLAVENYRKDREVIEGMSTLSNLYSRLEELEEKINK